MVKKKRVNHRESIVFIQIRDPMFEVTFEPTGINMFGWEFFKIYYMEKKTTRNSTMFHSCRVKDFVDNIRRCKFYLEI